MDESFSVACSETIEILKNCGENVKRKIPKKFMDFLENHKDKNYIPKIDFDNDNWKDTVTDKTKRMIALIYRDYIVSKEERLKLLEEEKEIEERLEKERREKYSYDNIFKKEKIKEEVIAEEKVENTSIAVIDSTPLYKRIINKILKFFNLK